VVRVDLRKEPVKHDGDDDDDGGHRRQYGRRNLSVGEAIRFKSMHRHLTNARKRRIRSLLQQGPNKGRAQSRDGRDRGQPMLKTFGPSSSSHELPSRQVSSRSKDI
jgi:hypothetical protein